MDAMLGIADENVAREPQDSEVKTEIGVLERKLNEIINLILSRKKESAVESEELYSRCLEAKEEPDEGLEPILNIPEDKGPFSRKRSQGETVKFSRIHEEGAFEDNASTSETSKIDEIFGKVVTKYISASELNSSSFSFIHQDAEKAGSGKRLIRKRRRSPEARPENSTDASLKESLESLRSEIRDIKIDMEEIIAFKSEREFLRSLVESEVGHIKTSINKLPEVLANATKKDREEFQSYLQAINNNLEELRAAYANIGDFSADQVKSHEAQDEESASIKELVGNFEEGLDSIKSEISQVKSDVNSLKINFAAVTSEMKEENKRMVNLFESGRDELEDIKEQSTHMLSYCQKILEDIKDGNFQDQHSEIKEMKKDMKTTLQLVRGYLAYLEREIKAEGLRIGVSLGGIERENRKIKDENKRIKHSIRKINSIVQKNGEMMDYHFKGMSKENLELKEFCLELRKNLDRIQGDLKELFLMNELEDRRGLKKVVEYDERVFTKNRGQLVGNPSRASSAIRNTREAADRWDQYYVIGSGVRQEKEQHEEIFSIRENGSAKFGDESTPAPEYASSKDFLKKAQELAKESIEELKRQSLETAFSTTRLF